MYPQQPPGWGPPQRPQWAPAPQPVKKAATLPLTALLAVVLLAFAACCAVSAIAKRNKEREDERARVAAAAEQARLARVERARFVAMTPVAHLARARAALTNERGVNDATLADARRNLDAVPADAGAPEELGELNRLYARRFEANAAENARQAAEADRERRRHETACAPRQAWVRILMSVNEHPDVAISVGGADCRTFAMRGEGCSPETLWVIGRGYRRDLRSLGFSTIQCTHSDTGENWSQPLPVPSRYVPPEEPASVALSGGAFAPSGRRCRRGCPCGNSCIPCSHRCRH